MLFLSEATLQAKNELITLVESKSDHDKELLKILELDPNDDYALLLLSRRRSDAGDRATAEALLWRSVEAQPCAWANYQELSMLLDDQEPLAKGLFELACRKLMRDDEAMEEMEEAPRPLEWEGTPVMQDMSVWEGLDVMADWLREQRDVEPEAVTARLRPHRLIQQLREAETIDRQFVDELVQEGASMVPFLTGILRGWVFDLIPDGDIAAVENSLALLGEIGETSTIADLLQMSTADAPELVGPAHWALGRIVAQHPEEAARIMKELAPGLDGGARIAIMECLLRSPGMDPNGKLLERLFEKMDGLDKKDREFCFPFLLLAGGNVRGRAFADTARGLLRRHSSLLSRPIRRECEEMIEEIESRRSPEPPPEPFPWTVYQICNGEVDWEAEMKEEEEEDYPPEPMRRREMPNRNDPCWCGSGKKYKKCHLEADEQEVREKAAEGKAPAAQFSELDQLRRNVGELLERLPREERSASITEFFGDEKVDPDMAAAMVVDWVVHDRISETYGRPVIEEYLHRHRSELSERERQFLESSASSCVDLLEVRDVKAGTGVEVKSLTSGETLFVHDIRMSKTLVLWDGIHARIISAERGLEFSGMGIQVPRNHLEALRSWMGEDRRRTGLSWLAYLKGNWPRIRAQGQKIGNEWLDNLRLKNNDGDDLVLSKATYRVVNLGALIASLRSSVEIDETEEGTHFTWLNGPAGKEGLTVLGSFRLLGGDLTLECNSKQRLKRGKKLLSELAGTSVVFGADEFTTQKDMMSSLKDRPSEEASRDRDRIPPEVERQVVGKYMEDHYARWPDMKLPALDGKTPRQAVRNAVGKRKVAELLKQFENGEERKRKAGEYAYDISRLRAELGIKQ